MSPATPKPFNLFFSGKKPRIFGHRGAAGEAPENTLVSFQRAFEQGAQFVELDVRGAEDGEAVIIHDATLKRTTNGRDRVSRCSLKELKTLDAGYWFTKDGGRSYPYRGKEIEIPTLGELFGALPQVRAIIEIKQLRPPIVNKVIESVRQAHKEEEVLLATESDEIMQEIRAELRSSGLSIVTGFSYGEVADFMSWLARGRKAPYSPPGQAFQIPCEYAGMTLVSEQTLKASHELGVEMFVWTVNEPGEMRRLLALGADGIITDFPALACKLVSGERP